MKYHIAYNKTIPLKFKINAFKHPLSLPKKL